MNRLLEIMGCVPSREHIMEDDGCAGYIALQHVRQSYSWDCGLACVMMVLREKGMTCTLEDLMQVCGTKSVWTVDLAYILSRYGVNFTFYTVTDGVRPEYDTEAFYKADIDKDMLRVNRLFESAGSLNIRIEKRSVDSAELVASVQAGYMAIVLIDKRLLPGNTLARLIQNSISMGYIGHYVIVCGFHQRTQSVVITDPASAEARLRVPLSEFDVAVR
jgi:hypothetical protein